LNVGCGTDIRQGWVNIDSAKLPGVDMVVDIQKTPLPFKTGTFDEILCQDILEHIDHARFTAVLRELHRILKTGGTLTIQVPHFTSRYNYLDPTHVKRFSILTFEFFVKGSAAQRDYYFDFHFRKIASARITFERGIFVYNYLVEPLVNLRRRVQMFYEATFLSRLFPAANIVVELVK
jgi:ubiquinone/menaquinone biosynthesis C-methylase UbiE